MTRTHTRTMNKWEEGARSRWAIVIKHFNATENDAISDFIKTAGGVTEEELKKAKENE